MNFFVASKSFQDCRAQFSLLILLGTGNNLKYIIPCFQDLVNKSQTSLIVTFNFSALKPEIQYVPILKQNCAELALLLLLLIFSFTSADYNFMLIIWLWQKQNFVAKHVC